MHTYSFEKLEVWKLARVFVKQVYQMTSFFPDTEKFGMTSQMRRAALSICNNLAEGSTRSTMKDQSHFSVIAYGSLIEVLNMLIISKDLNLIEEEQYLEMRPSIEELSNKLNAFRNAQLSRVR